MEAKPEVCYSPTLKIAAIIRNLGNRAFSAITRLGFGFCSARLQAGIVDSKTCPSESGRYKISGLYGLFLLRLMSGLKAGPPTGYETF